MPRRIGLTFAEWPQADRAAWNRAFASVGFFDEGASAAHWRPKTRQQAQYAYARWLAHLKEHDSQALNEQPAARTTIDRVREYVEQLKGRMTPMSVAAQLQHLLLAFKAIAQEGDWSWLRRWQSAYQKRARPREKRSKMVDPRLLSDLGFALMDSADQEKHSAGRARRYRDGLLIALLTARPLRRRSLTSLEIGRNVHFVAGRYFIELAEHDTKAGHSIAFDVPETLTDYLTRYLERYRPLFPGAIKTTALWLSSKGGPLAAGAIYLLVCRRTRDAFGTAIHPHLFRDIAVTTIAREAPHALPIARDLLTHSKLETTQHYYSQARSADAARVHAEVLAQLRAVRGK